MKISIITAIFNSRSTLKEAIESLSGQTYKNIEHIIIDGASIDGTVDVIREYERSDGGERRIRWISEPDRGIYDAVNKGVRLATGEVIGLLHGDDFYAHEGVISRVTSVFENEEVDSCYSDLVYVDRNDTDKVIRYWKAGSYSKDKFRRGWMPPHPTFFCKRKIYEKYGLLNLDFPLAADYELMLRFLYKYNVSTTYIPKVLVKMRTKGTSKPGLYTFKAIIENHRAWKVNKLNYPITLLLKPFSKVSQFVRK